MPSMTFLCFLSSSSAVDESFVWIKARFCLDFLLLGFRLLRLPLPYS